MGLLGRVCPPVGEQDEALDWPWWVPLGCIGASVAVTLKVLADRQALLSPGADTVLGALAVSPWLVELWLLERTGRTLARLPFAVVVIGAVTALLLEPTEYDFAPFLLVAMVVEIAVTASLRVSAGVTLAAMASLVALDVFGSSDGASTWVAGVAASGALGALLRSRMLLVERERVVAAGLAERAVTEERRRIAREVHDVIAHSLSVTMLHVTGTRHLLETEGDVDEAVVALRDAERLGRQAMTDIRRTVGLLGVGAAAEPSAPMPGLGDLGDLVADFRAAGMEVGHRLVGDPAPLSLATGLGLYRIVQESLANVAKHAPGSRAEVHVDVTGDPLRLTVRNHPPPNRNRSAPGMATTAAAAAEHLATTPHDGEVALPVTGATARVGADGPAERSVSSGGAVEGQAATGRADGGLSGVDGAASGPGVGEGSRGLGIPGMRQRTELLGGVLRAGPDGDGWAVEVVVPRASGES